MTGTIFDIKEMAVHDGPGLRTTVFFKGCPLRCRWCHNPEGLERRPQLLYKKARCLRCDACRQPCTHEECKPFGRCIHVCPENCLEIAGREVTATALARELKQTAEVLGGSFGGFTVSGGEPLAQPEFLLELLGELNGYHLCVETSGYAGAETFAAVVDRLDYVIMDLKLADSQQHRTYTGVDNEPILRNFRYLKESGKPFLIRTPLIPGITDTEENLAAIARLTDGCEWEKLPYNGAAGAKYAMLGMEYELGKEREG